jgi:pimeloyl-ACP methyl ester carboxylesterase
LGWVGNKAIRGGVGWEDFEQSPLDIRAWVNLMDELSAQGVALIGHSYGAAKVTYSQAHAQDVRVLGLGFASTRIRVGVDPSLVNAAERMLAETRGDEPLPWGSIPSIIGYPTLSARTYLGRARIPDLFGAESAHSCMLRCGLGV